MELLEFEKPIAELQDELTKLQEKSSSQQIDLSSEISDIEGKLMETRREIYDNLTPWQRVQIARHNKRPFMLDYVAKAFDHFSELHGDRVVGDDHAMPGGFGTIAGERCVVLGHQKGRDLKENLKRNFGSAHPEGYRKSLRLMQLAEKFSLPVVALIDTPGAFPGIGAEERNIAESIARNLREMMILKVPIIAVVLGEGGVKELKGEAVVRVNRADGVVARIFERTAADAAVPSRICDGVLKVARAEFGWRLPSKIYSTDRGAVLFYEYEVVSGEPESGDNIYVSGRATILDFETGKFLHVFDPTLAMWYRDLQAATKIKDWKRLRETEKSRGRPFGIKAVAIDGDHVALLSADDKVQQYSRTHAKLMLYRIGEAKPYRIIDFGDELGSEGEIEPENPEPKLAALEIKSELLLDGADHRMVVSMVEEANLSEDDSTVLPEVAPEERAVFYQI